MAMLVESPVTTPRNESDRPFHHELAMAAYDESFRHRCLTDKYRMDEIRRLQEVCSKVSIADPERGGVSKLVDTFDLFNPYQAVKVREAVYRDISSKSGSVACLKSIDRYCRFLKDNPTVSIVGNPLYLPSLYGPIESPVNRYTIPRSQAERTPNRNYLELSEYKQWLQFTWSQIQPDLPIDKRLKASQLHLMCVIAGEMGLRLKEILGLQPEHFILPDGVCVVLRGKGSNGSGDRKRVVPVSPLVKASLSDFLKSFTRNKGEALFQNRHGQRLSNNTAHHWMDALICNIRAAGLPIFVDSGFGWHGFRRTYTRRFLEQGGNIFELKRNTGWVWTSTISHYMGDCKQKATPSGPPLLGRMPGHGR